MVNTINEAIDDLKEGKMVIVVDDENRENEGDLLALADNVSNKTINFMIKYGKGLVCCPITSEKAKSLNLPLMVRNSTDNLRTSFTVSVDHISNTTGISAFERADTVNALASDETTPQDFIKPGHIFPLIAVNGGVLERPGHTEAAVDLARLCGSSPLGVICEIINDDGEMARLPDLTVFANKYELKIITIADLVKFIKKQN